jgi:hypothetical protein
VVGEWVCGGGGDWRRREEGGEEADVGVGASFCLLIDACVCRVVLVLVYIYMCVCWLCVIIRGGVEEG